MSQAFCSVNQYAYSTTQNPNAYGSIWETPMGTYYMPGNEVPYMTRTPVLIPPAILNPPMSNQIELDSGNDYNKNILNSVIDTDHYFYLQHITTGLFVILGDEGNSVALGPENLAIKLHVDKSHSGSDPKDGAKWYQQVRIKTVDKMSNDNSDQLLINVTSVTADEAFKVKWTKNGASNQHSSWDPVIVPIANYSIANSSKLKNVKLQYFDIIGLANENYQSTELASIVGPDELGVAEPPLVNYNTGSSVSNPNVTKNTAQCFTNNFVETPGGEQVGLAFKIIPVDK